MSLSRVLTGLTIGFLLATTALADRLEQPKKTRRTEVEPRQPISGNRSNHWSGFDIGGGIPFPAVGGVLIGFNIGDDARVSFGSGTAIDWAVYQLDAKFFLAPDPWALYLGTGLGYMSGNKGKYLFWDLQFDKTFLPYIEFGLDFQSDVGVHLGFGIAGSVLSGNTVVLPNLALGWYF